MLTNFHELARFVNLDPFEALARADISPDSLDDPENWISAANVLALLDDCAARSGRDDFGVLLGASRTFTSIGPVSLLMKHEATVRDIIISAREYKHLVNDLLNLWIIDDGENAVIQWGLVPGLHSAQGVNLIAAIAYRSIAEALEANWEPDCIHFRHAVPEHAVTFNRYFRCALEFDSNFDGMSCASANLRTANPFADPELARYARRLLNLLPSVRQDSASDKVRSVIPLFMEDCETSAERVAQCLGVDLRTLQRRLNAEGSSYTTLLNESRRELVIRNLTSSSRPLTVVAQSAGFSSLSAFTRWFTRQFGVPPQSWRKQMAQKVLSTGS